MSKSKSSELFGGVLLISLGVVFLLDKVIGDIEIKRSTS